VIGEPPSLGAVHRTVAAMLAGVAVPIPGAPGREAAMVRVVGKRPSGLGSALPRVSASPGSVADQVPDAAPAGIVIVCV
jgi:hypothetical protein